jgi:hypothetical protein
MTSMEKTVGLGVLALALGGCVVVHDTPQQRPPATPPPAPAPATAAPPPAATPAPATPIAPTTPIATPAAVADGPRVNVGGRDLPTVKSATIFGGGTSDGSTFPGLVYWIPANSAALPALDSLTPVGAIFARGFTANTGVFSGGFPGIDASHNENFAIRYDASFSTSIVGEHIFRLTSDDGARVSVDGVVVVNDDQRHPPKDAAGRVKLGRGSHHLRVDYFQGTGGVALQLFVTPPGGTEKAFSLTM